MSTDVQIQISVRVKIPYLKLGMSILKTDVALKDPESALDY